MSPSARRRGAASGVGSIDAGRDAAGESDRLRALFESSPCPAAVLRGPDHRVELANAAFAALGDGTIAAGVPVASALPAGHDAGFVAALDLAYASGTRARCESVGPSRRIDFTVEPLRDAAGDRDDAGDGSGDGSGGGGDGGDGGAVTGLLVHGIDLTAAHEQARDLHESEEKFRTFAQAMPHHVWTAPADGQLDWFNQQTLAYSGMSAAELSGIRWVQLVHPDDVERAAVAWAGSLASGADYEVEFRIRRADGAYRWHLVRALPIRDAAGAVVRWVGTNTDIEQQRADREALRRLNAELEQRVVERTRDRERIWRNSPDLMAVVSADGVINEANPAWGRVLGWPLDRIVGLHMSAVVHPDDLASAEEALSQAGVDVLPTFECRILHADSRWRDIAWTAAPEGSVVFAFGRDITVAKAQRQALLLAEEQLRQAQKMEAIGQLTGGIAHDFNNMLASISGAMQLMQRRLEAGRIESLAGLLERASASTQRAASLTQRLLAFARRQSLDIRRVDVVRLVRSLDDLLLRTLGPRITLTLTLPDDTWTARIDGAQLENALLNLVINARDAMPDGGQLTITTGNVVIAERDAAAHDEVEPGEYVVVRVGDDGVGMPASVFARAFEPFFTTKPIGQGTGLGLSMVYGFVKQAGGHVGIDSAPGRGTTVSVFLPRDDSTADDLQPQAPTPVPPEPGAGETILIVEDEPDVRAVIVAVLSDLGYRLVEAVDAPSALAVVESGCRIDLLVTDVGLPGMNGRQLAEIAITRRPGLKVLFVTGYAEQAAARQGFLEAGMEMITKPFVVDELARRIRTILAAGGTAGGAGASIGSAGVD